MKVIIAGSRGVTNPTAVEAAIRASGFQITEVISGTAEGADQLGEQWAASHGVPVRRFPADWNRFGRSAGYRRNVEMAEYAEALIAIWDGQSRGTKHMLEIAHERRLPICLRIVCGQRR